MPDCMYIIMIIIISATINHFYVHILMLLDIISMYNRTVIKH